MSSLYMFFVSIGDENDSDKLRIIINVSLIEMGLLVENLIA